MRELSRRCSVSSRSVMGTQVQAIEKALRDSASTPPETVQTSPFDRKATAAAIARLQSIA